VKSDLIEQAPSGVAARCLSDPVTDFVRGGTSPPRTLL
jgi:hypothetical protein